MVRKFLRKLVCTVFLLLLPASAIADCSVKATLDRLLQTQLILAQGRPADVVRQAVAYLRRQSFALVDTQVMRAARGHSRPDAPAIFLQFLQATRLFAAQVSDVDLPVIRAYFQRPDVRDALQQVGRYLAEFECSEADVTDAPTPYLSPAGSDPADWDMPLAASGSQGREAWPVTGAWRDLPLVLWPIIAVVGCAGVWFMRMRLALARRRRRRYPCRIETELQMQENRADGVLVDISAHGAKLRYLGDAPLVIGQRLRLSIQDSVVSGNVTWANQHYVGLRFETPLTFVQVRSVRKAADSKQ